MYKITYIKTDELERYITSDIATNVMPQTKCYI